MHSECSKECNLIFTHVIAVCDGRSLLLVASTTRGSFMIDDRRPTTPKIPAPRKYVLRSQQWEPSASWGCPLASHYPYIDTLQLFGLDGGSGVGSIGLSSRSSKISQYILSLAKQIATWTISGKILRIEERNSSDRTDAADAAC